MSNVENVPVKSSKRYEKQYEEFGNWCSKRNVEKYTDDVLLDYFLEISDHVKASTLWVKYSMLKVMLLARNNVFIGRFPKLLDFLKRKNEDYQPTKSKTLTVEQVEQFLTEAPDKEFLVVKVALILSIAGACKRDELASLSTNDVKDLGSSLLFNIKKPGIDRIFIVKNSENNSVDFVNLCKKYMSLRRKDTDHSRFFVQYRNSTCYLHPVGINSFGKMPQKIASFLNLPEASLYTGHCFKSTSASLQAEAGAEDILKWTTVTEGGPRPTTAVFLPEAPTTSFDIYASTSNEENINNNVDSNFTRIKNEANDGEGNSATSSSSSLTNASLEIYGTCGNRVVCRFCLHNVNKEICTSLQFLQNSSSSEKKIEKSIEIKSMIKFSFPNLDLSLSSAPMICDLCTTSLTSTYKFISQTMLNQNTIKAYMTEKCIAGDVNLDEVVETKKRRIDDSNQPERNSQATKQSEIFRKFEQVAEVQSIDNMISEEGNSDAGFVEVKIEPKDECIGTLEYLDSEQDFIKEEEIKIESHYVDYETLQAITGESTSDALNSSEIMDSVNFDEILCTSPGVPEEAETATANLLPPKSKTKYKHAYLTLTKWLKSKNSKLISENLLLSYFNEVSKKWKPPTLWAHYSMLKSTLHLHNNIQIENYRKVTAFLKQINLGYRGKKAKVFTPIEIEKFLNEAPDEKYLASKVACIFGISTACRRMDLTKIKVGDVEEHGKIFLIKIANPDTHAYKSFTVDEKLCDIIRKYIDSRPKNVHSNRFFLNWQNGKCTHQVIGINKFGQIPKQIAQFLKLPDANLYTGHCFRRTSTTLLADAGVSIKTIKRHVGWNSAVYEEDSMSNKIKISRLITEEIMIPVRNSKRETPQLMQIEKEDFGSAPTDIRSS